MTIPQEAIEAAAEQFSAHVHGDVDFDALTEGEQSAARVATGDIIDAALPALERQIREQVAKEIEAARPAVHPARKGGKAAHYALTNAARIARGYWL